MASAQTAVRRRFVFDTQPIWRLLTSARFAVIYISLLAAVGMLGGFFDAGGASGPANEASQARTARRLCAACEHHS